MRLEHAIPRVACSFFVVVCLLASGCGGNGDADGSGSTTKAEFIDEGDAICEKTDRRQAARFKAYVAKNGEDNSRAGQEELITEVGLPAIRIEIEELRELELPLGGEDEVAAILDGAEEAVEATENDPGKMFRTSGDPFSEVEKLARDYGFEDCGLT